MKKCKQCLKTKPMVVRWVIFNYGRIPWNSFMLPREKKALAKALTVVDETMPPEYHEEVVSYLMKERENNERSTS